MPGLMHTYDEVLTNEQRCIAAAMILAARDAMREWNVTPRNDDEAARFDEACAKFLLASVPRAEDAPVGYTKPDPQMGLNPAAMEAALQFAAGLGGGLSLEP